MLDRKDPDKVEQFVNEVEISTEQETPSKKETVALGLLRLLEFGLNFPFRFRNWLYKYDYDLWAEFQEIKDVFQTKSNIYTESRVYKFFNRVNKKLIVIFRVPIGIKSFRVNSCSITV